jgi:hypothetical protein
LIDLLSRAWRSKNLASLAPEYPLANSVRKSLGFSRCSTNLQRNFPVESLSHFFSSLEEGNGFLSDRDDNSSAGIAASPRSAELSRKRSETPQLHSISARQSFNDLV